MRGWIVLSLKQQLATTQLLIDSLKGNEYESYMTRQLWMVYYELQRQIKKENNIKNVTDVTDSKKDWDDFWEALWLLPRMKLNVSSLTLLKRHMTAIDIKYGA